MTGGCATECERLAALGETLDDLPAARNWRASVQALSQAPDVETLSGERRLDVLTAELRRLFLGDAHRRADPFMKSPPHDGAPIGLGDHTVDFTYERNLSPHPLEARLASYRPAPDGWTGAHVAFRSGMAALACWLQCRARMVTPTSGQPLRLGMRGGYFETRVLLELLRGTGLVPEILESAEELERAVLDSAVDDVLVEPVIYDWELETLDLAALVAAWRGARVAPRALVIDTTLVGRSFPVDQMLARLRGRPPEVVVVVHSGLKLDQQGLELANVGLLSVYTPRDAPPASADEIGDLLRKMRTILGVSLSLDELVALDAPFVLDPAATEAYQHDVFRNNALLAHALTQCVGGIFAKVAHPSLGGDAARPWARAPFVIAHLAEDDLRAHGLLLAVLALEAADRDVPLVMGSSFGFRHNRAETIIPRLTQGRGLFKIAMGARSGPARAATIRMIANLAQLSDVDALRRAYPHAVPVTFPEATA